MEDTVMPIAFSRLIVLISELEYMVSSQFISNTRLNKMIIPFRQ